MMVTSAFIFCTSDLVYAEKAGDWCIVAGMLTVILSSFVVALGSDKSASTLCQATCLMSSGGGIGLDGFAVEVSDILVGGSGSSHIQKGHG
jgi:hypothetical protein